MRAAIVVIVVATIALAHADPVPKKVDITPFRAELLVFADAAGNAYVLKPHTATESGRIFFGPSGKTLHEQVLVGRSKSGSAWSYQTWAPRIPGIRPAYLMQKADGSHHKTCADDKHDVALTQLTGDKAKQVLDKSTFMTEALLRRPHVFARDDAGVYYYVDKLSEKYGGKGY